MRETATCPNRWPAKKSGKVFGVCHAAGRRVETARGLLRGKRGCRTAADSRRRAPRRIPAVQTTLPLPAPPSLSSSGAPPARLLLLRAPAVCSLVQSFQSLSPVRSLAAAAVPRLPSASASHRSQDHLRHPSPAIHPRIPLSARPARIEPALAWRINTRYGICIRPDYFWSPPPLCEFIHIDRAYLLLAQPDPLSDPQTHTLVLPTNIHHGFLRATPSQ